MYFYFRHVWFLFHRDVASWLRATLVRSRSALPEVHAHRHVVLERRRRECDRELVVENDCGPLPLFPRWPILIRRGDYEGVLEASHGDVNWTSLHVYQRHFLLPGRKSRVVPADCSANRLDRFGFEVDQRKVDL